MFRLSCIGRFLLLAIAAAALLYRLPEAGAEPERLPQAAFVRGSDLWLSIGGVEIQATAGDRAAAPTWSADGQFVAYAAGEQGDRICVYSVAGKQSFPVYDGGVNFKWAPAGNRLAFLSGGLLNVADITAAGAAPFRNVVGGVGNYSWQAGGSGFLVSTNAQLLPDGWTSVRLLEVPADANMDPSRAKPLFTLPKPSDNFFAVGTSPFRWSADRSRIAFIAHPTASLSADSNTLCVLSADGRDFRTPARMLNDYHWFQWAPRAGTLAFLEGEGRFVLEDRKRLGLTRFAAARRPDRTPPGTTERDFAWIDDRTIVVSRSAFAGKDVAPAERPLPALYRVPLPDGEQRQFTVPPPGSGDFAPTALGGGRTLAWVRTDRTRADAWIADADGAKARVFISGIGVGESYYERWNWDDALAWYDPPPLAPRQAR